ncbi:peptidase [Bacillus altitudinis]|uniref:peptidase n=1 Tax=Bacillus altitudinis TaxID=293387 RepID=UPI000542E27B|nr:peptidase [Bacillus altitudinis]KWZ65072.1 acetylornithine deacetylase [Bacillus altitudinis]QXJ48090.1 peptidase [Bacillus altitudinis]
MQPMTGIRNWMKEHQDEAITLLQKMVQCDSTQGNEEEVQQIVANKLSAIGFDVDVWEIGDDELLEHPYFYSPRRSFQGSPNVAGRLKGKGGGKSILLNGHVDVVPAGDTNQWTYPPYSGHIINGRLYGRGATDMKGGNVSLLFALEALHALQIPLKGDVVFHSVVEEESGGAGTLAAILKGYTADAAIIPEPSHMNIFPLQQGSKWFRLHIKGRAAHGGTRYHGVSAIEKSTVVLSHIEALEKERNQRVTEPLFQHIPIPIPINIGKIQGGDWPSSVADLVTMEGRLGVMPGETVEQAEKELENWMTGLAEKDAWFQEHPVEVEWFGARWLPGSIDSDHPLLGLLKEQYEEVMQHPPKVEAAPWGTDGGLLSQAADIPIIVFGPGTTELAHFPNESIEIKHVIEAAEIIAGTLVKWCEAAE